MRRPIEVRGVPFLAGTTEKRCMSCLEVFLVLHRGQRAVGSMVKRVRSTKKSTAIGPSFGLRLVDLLSREKSSRLLRVIFFNVLVC